MNIFKQIKDRLLYKKFPMVGVDIYDNGIEILQLNVNKEKRTHLRKELKSNFYKNNHIVDDDEFAGFLKEIIRKAKPRLGSKDFLLALPDKDTFFWVFEIKNEESNLEEEIKKIAGEKLPLDLKDCYFDYLINNNKSKEVFFVAAPKEKVDPFIKLFEKADLNLEIVDFESGCLVRSLFENEEIEQPTFIIDMGAQTTDIVLVDKKGFRDQIDIPIAGNEITQRISTELKIDFKEAETVKIKKGLLNKEKDLDNILPKVLNSVFEEIDKIKQDYERKTKKQVKKIILVGGGSLLKGLVKLFNKKFKDLKIELSQDNKKSVGKTVTGLALRGISSESAFDGINLIKILK